MVWVEIPKLPLMTVKATALNDSKRSTRMYIKGEISMYLCKRNFPHFYHLSLTLINVPSEL